MRDRALSLAFLLGTTATLSAQSNVSFELYADTYATGNYNAIISGDFDNDGKPDLVQCCNSAGLMFRRGNGDGSFQGAVTAAIASDGAAEFVVADVNGDGKLDIVGLPAYGNYALAPNGTGLAIWLGNGDGTFQAPQVYSTTYGTSSVAVGNFFGDGYPDIAVGESESNIDLFRNQGNGNYVYVESIQLGSNSESQVQLAAGDLNGNGISNLAAAVGGGGGNGEVYVLWNDGRGDFTQQALAAYVNPTVNISRLNGDGMMDILVGYTCNPQQSTSPNGHQPSYNACAGFDAYYGQGNSHLFKRTLVNQPGVYNLGIPFGVDVNGDGYGDIASSGSLSTPYGTFGLFVWPGNADGSFQQTAQEFIDTTSGYGAFTTGDFARNGRMDFVMNGYPAEFFINSTDRPTCGTYTISPTVTVCQPVDNTYSPSPVPVDAHSFDTTTVTAMQEYVDGALEYSQPVTSFDATFPVSNGTHLFTTKGWDASGLSFAAGRTITVYSGTPGPVCPVAPDSASICLPSGIPGNSPVLILANGNTGAIVPTSAQLYVDGTLVVDNQGYCYNNGNCAGGTSYVQTSQSLSAGTHNLVFKLWDANGNVYTASQTITVN